MTDKKVYVRLCLDAINGRGYRPNFSSKSDMFIRALRELVERCPDVTREELLELLVQADSEIVKL